MYRSLQYKSGISGDLGNGLSATAFAIPALPGRCRDILYATDPATFGAGVFLYRALADGGYSAPELLPELSGHYAMPLEWGEGQFHVLSYAASAGYHGKIEAQGHLQLFESGGSTCPYHFSQPRKLAFGGQSLKEILHNPDRLSLSPFRRSESVTDLVVCCNYDRLNYWPDRRHGWRDDYHLHLGPGRSYDEDGRYRGGVVPTEIFLLRNLGDNQSPRFGIPELLYRFVSYDICSDACLWDLDGEGRATLVFRRDVDQLFFVKPDANMKFCSEPQLLTRLKRAYFETSLHVCDFDGDGEEELLVSGNPGICVCLKRRDGEWQESQPLTSRARDIRVETLATVTMCDMSHSGRPDLIAGDASGYLRRFPGSTRPLEFEAGQLLAADNEVIHHQAGINGSIQGPNESRWGYTNPCACHWTDSTRFDLLVNDIRGDLTLYRNIGTAEAPEFASPIHMNCMHRPMTIAWRSGITVWDAERLLVLNYDGVFQLFRKDPSDWQNLLPDAILRYEDGSPIRGCGINTMWGRTVPFAFDWFRPGTNDLLVGTEQTPIFDTRFPVCATVLLLENIGTNLMPCFRKARLVTLKNGDIIHLGLHQCGVFCSKTLLPGQTVLIAGAEDGKFYYWLREELLYDHASEIIWPFSRYRELNISHGLMAK